MVSVTKFTVALLTWYGALSYEAVDNWESILEKKGLLFFLAKMQVIRMV